MKLGITFYYENYFRQKRSNKLYEFTLLNPNLEIRGFTVMMKYKNNFFMYSFLRNTKIYKTLRVEDRGNQGQLKVDCSIG